MISCSSSTASSTPATSRNVIFGESTLMRLARDLPNDITFEPPPWTWFIRKIQNPMKIRIGKTYVSRLRITLERAGLTSQPLSLPSASAFCRRCCSIAAESPWTQPDRVALLVGALERDLGRVVLRAQDDVVDLTVVDLLEELAERRLRRLVAALDQLGGEERQHDHDQDRERGALEEAAHEPARIPRAEVIRRDKMVKATRGIAGPKRVCAVWCAILCARLIKSGQSSVSTNAATYGRFR